MSLTSGATRTDPSSATTARSTSDTARPRRARRQTPQRGDSVALDSRDPGRVAHRVPPPAGHRRHGGALAIRTRSPDRVPADQLPIRTYRDALGLDSWLDFHGLRRSYVTHLIEAGRDPLFVQFQCGHEHASTTSLYTCVSSDFRTRTLRRALDDTLAAALEPTGRAR
jgi:integrase